MKTGVTVVGNVAVDRVNGASPSAGGCPSFVGFAARDPTTTVTVVTHLASDDRPLFAPVLLDLGARVTALPALRTSAFGLEYSGDDCVLTVDAIGDPWTEDELVAAAITSSWVHVAPLLRSDFPPETIAYLVAQGHQVSFDGQGLIRVPRVGSLELDANFDRALLAGVSVLKLNSEEAAVVASGEFTHEAAAKLEVPEILVTLGSRGCQLFLDGRVVHIPATRTVSGVHATGSGDTFMVAYLSKRATGTRPAEAAHHAASVVANMLEFRREALLASR
jgi:sugar/nucleoside kinase (ribokinase family)